MYNPPDPKKDAKAREEEDKWLLVTHNCRTGLGLSMHMAFMPMEQRPPGNAALKILRKSDTDHNCGAFPY